MFTQYPPELARLINRERIDEAALKTRDEVQIGKFRLVFYAGAAQ